MFNKKIKILFTICLCLFLFLMAGECLAITTCSEKYKNDGQCLPVESCPQDKAIDSDSQLCPNDLACCHQFTAPIELKLQVPLFGYTEARGLAEYIGKVYQYSLYVIIILAIIVVMFAGFRWITSAGDPAKIKESKNLIIGSVLGVLIAYLGGFILTLFGLGTLKELQVAEIPARGDTIVLDGVAMPVSEAMNKLAPERRGTVGAFDSASCNKNETSFQVFFTNYYTPEYGDRGYYRDFWCNIAVQCTCPKGKNKINCNISTLPGYTGCNEFPQGTPYCNATASGKTPIGNYTIAADKNCFNLKSGCKFTIAGDSSGRTYEIQDTGSAIKGHHMDFYIGVGKTNMNKIAGVYTITLVNPAVCYK